MQNLKGESGDEIPMTYIYVPSVGTEMGKFEVLGKDQTFAKGQILILRKENRIRMIKVLKENVSEGTEVRKISNQSPFSLRIETQPEPCHVIFLLCSQGTGRNFQFRAAPWPAYRFSTRLLGAPRIMREI